MSSLGVFWDERCLQHETGSGHPERPDRLRAVREVLDHHQKLEWLQPLEITSTDLLRVHDAQHVARMADFMGMTLRLDADTVVSAGSITAAQVAVGGVMAAVDAVLGGHLKTVFVFVRPPGHHAEEDHAMGFCLYNNVALGAEFALTKSLVSRVAIVDYDVHHGNGTQHHFYKRDDVFFASLHRFPFYPGTGASWETGEGPGLNHNLNVTFDRSVGDEQYIKAFDDDVVPALDSYKPDFILVSAGFDAHHRDPIGGMRVTQKGFAHMNKRLHEVAQKHCDGRIVFVLEGGYDLKGLQDGVESLFDAVI